MENKRIAQRTSKQRETKDKQFFHQKKKAQVNKIRIKEELIKQIVFGGPEFSFLHWHGASQLSITPVIGYQMLYSSLHRYQTCTW